MSATIVQSGTYLLEIGTGNIVNKFTLNSATLGILDTSILEGEPEFADITAYADSIDYRRGRQRVVDQQNQAGLLNFRMADNVASGNLNPLYSGSTFWSTSEGVPGLAPMRPVRLSRSGVYLFKGRVTSYTYEYQLGGLDLVNVHCSDDQLLLGQAILPATATSAQLSGARVTAILDNTAVAYPDTRSVSAGTVTVGAFAIAAETSASSYLQRVVEAEQGRLFVSRSGVLTFQDRIGTTLAAPTAVFSDAGQIPYNEVSIEFDQTNVVNRAAVTIEGGTEQVAADAASQALYFVQAVGIGDSLLSTDGQALTLADYLLEPYPQPRYSRLGTTFSLLNDAQRTTVAALEIGDTIQVTKAMLAGGSITQVLAIEGIDATITVSGGHSVTLYTSPQVVLSTFILDDPAYGILSTTNALG